MHLKTLLDLVMGREMVQSGYQVLGAWDQSQGWMSVIMVDGEKHHGCAITVSMMPLLNVKVWLL